MSYNMSTQKYLYKFNWTKTNKKGFNKGSYKIGFYHIKDSQIIDKEIEEIKHIISMDKTILGRSIWLFSIGYHNTSINY